jgi:hypothetical protein
VDTIVPDGDGGELGAAYYKGQSDFEKNIPDPRSKAQLDMLCKLIGRNSVSSSSSSAGFKLNLFNNEEEELYD